MNHFIQKNISTLSKSKLGSVSSVLIFALPIIISQACDSLMMLTDRYLLAKMDPIHTTAAMSGGMTAFLLWIFGAGVLGFVTPLVSQYMGSGDIQSARKVVPQGMILSLVLSLPLLLWGNEIGLMYFSFLELPQAELPAAKEYLAIMINAALFIFTKTVFASFFSGMGKTRIVMFVNVAGLIINIPMSYFLIHGGMGHEWAGIRGAALGTVCAEIAMNFMYLPFFFRMGGKKASWSIDITILKKLLLFGIPTGFEFFILTFAFATFLTMFHAFGLAASQAITATMNWAWLTVMPFFGLNIALMSLVGHAMGDNNPELAKKITTSGLKIGASIVLLASVGFLGATDTLLKILSCYPGEPAYDLATAMIFTLPFYCAADGFSFVTTATLRASGDTRFCLLVGSLCHWGCLGLSFYGIYHGDFSPFTVWCFNLGALSIQAVAYGLRYKQGLWQFLKVV